MSDLGERRNELRRLSYGGDGSHWENCHEHHWDCRILWLEDQLEALGELTPSVWVEGNDKTSFVLEPVEDPDDE